MANRLLQLRCYLIIFGRLRRSGGGEYVIADTSGPPHKQTLNTPEVQTLRGNKIDIEYQMISTNVWSCVLCLLSRVTNAGVKSVQTSHLSST